MRLFSAVIVALVISACGSRDYDETKPPVASPKNESLVAPPNSAQVPGQGAPVASIQTTAKKALEEKVRLAEASTMPGSKKLLGLSKEEQFPLLLTVGGVFGVFLGTKWVWKKGSALWKARKKKNLPGSDGPRVDGGGGHDGGGGQPFAGLSLDPEALKSLRPAGLCVILIPRVVEPPTRATSDTEPESPPASAGEHH